MRHVALPCLLLCLTMVSCTKYEEFSCTTPAIVLQQQGYTAAEWDTVITTVHLKNGSTVADTFITTATTNELFIETNNAEVTYYTIFLPSVQRSYTLRDIIINERTQTRAVGTRSICFNSISFYVDDQLYDYPGAVSDKVYATIMP